MIFLHIILEGIRRCWSLAAGRKGPNPAHYRSLSIGSNGIGSGKSTRILVRFEILSSPEWHSSGGTYLDHIEPEYGNLIELPVIRHQTFEGRLLQEKMPRVALWYTSFTTSRRAREQ